MHWGENLRTTVDMGIVVDYANSIKIYLSLLYICTTGG